MIHTYCKSAAGPGYVLYRNGVELFTAPTMLGLLAYLKANGIRNAEYRRPGQ